MSTAVIEHVNVTVSNPEQTANLLCRLFDWRVRWEGQSALGGRTVHVGNSDMYVAVYTSEQPTLGESPTQNSAAMPGGLNHIGLVVDDLAATEARILDAGFKTFSHDDYEPGRRFYFRDADRIEYEIVSYA